MHLVDYFTEHSSPLDIEDTLIDAQLHKLSVDAVLFDIYGTLVISASGDIGIAGKLSKSDAFVQALRDSRILPADYADCDQSLLLDCIEADHACSRDHGIPFPEVDIVEMWQQVGSLLSIAVSVEQAQEAAVRYEAATNPTWPMPNLDLCIDSLRDSGFDLGIISNAQFYTPLLFPAYMNRDIDALGFDADLRWYSYESKRAKPDTWMYEQAREALAQRGVAAERVLYVGNDMLNDMYPAQQCGFKTALFAGDKRSLRLREDHEQASQVQVDCILTDLQQLLLCVEK
ncbi:MAG: HAD family hydrolase [Planctomycetes bacterium]|nr:HAD family hydrolase [Planctomycetota bacterium]